MRTHDRLQSSACASRAPPAARSPPRLWPRSVARARSSSAGSTAASSPAARHRVRSRNSGAGWRVPTALARLRGRHRPRDHAPRRDRRHALDLVSRERRCPRGEAISSRCTCLSRRGSNHGAPQHRDTAAWPRSRASTLPCRSTLRCSPRRSTSCSFRRAEEVSLLVAASSPLSFSLFSFMAAEGIINCVDSRSRCRRARRVHVPRRTRLRHPRTPRAGPSRGADRRQPPASRHAARDRTTPIGTVAAAAFRNADPQGVRRSDAPSRTHCTVDATNAGAGRATQHARYVRFERQI